MPDLLTALRECVELEKKATKGPWSWDQRGEKTNEWGLGVAVRSDETPISGRFDDEDAVYVEYVCSHEAATCNYADPALICALRSLDLPALLAAVEDARRYRWLRNASLRQDRFPLVTVCYAVDESIRSDDWATVTETGELDSIIDTAIADGERP